MSLIETSFELKIDVIILKKCLSKNFKCTMIKFSYTLPIAYTWCRNIFLKYYTHSTFISVITNWLKLNYT